MARIRSGITGRPTGKVGSVVAANWKGTQTVREHVPATDVKSPAQLKNRTHYTFVNRFYNVWKEVFYPAFGFPTAITHTLQTAFFRRNFTRMKDIANIKNVLEVNATQPFPLPPMTRTTYNGDFSIEYPSTNMGPGIYGFTPTAYFFHEETGRFTGQIDVPLYWDGRFYLFTPNLPELKFWKGNVQVWFGLIYANSTPHYFMPLDWSNGLLPGTDQNDTGIIDITPP